MKNADEEWPGDAPPRYRPDGDPGMQQAPAGRRVVHVLNSTAVGGAETVVLRLGIRLQELGWTPEVVVLRGEGPLSASFLEAGIPVTDLRVPPRGGAWAMRAAMRAWWRQERPPLLHTHNVSPLVAAALALPRHGGTRLVHTKHGRARSASLRGRLVTRWAAGRADAIVAVSRDAASRAIEREGFPADRVSLIYNGIDTGRVTARTGAWRQRLVTVARLEPVKSLDLLLRALAHLRGTGHAATLTVVGDGTEREALEQLTRELGLVEHVTFTGWTRNVESYLGEADLFVMSSRSEGLSLTLLEAMAVGLPVVATDVGGNPEVIEEGVTGHLVPHGSPQALAGAMAAVLARPDRAAAMGAAGRQRVLARFSLDVMADAYSRVYQGR
jgi:glycosyltransferase involved in cell wall biosynthesis